MKRTIIFLISCFVFLLKAINPIFGITGNTMVCVGSTNTYTVSGSTASSGFTWSLPTYASIVSGAGTRTITVQFNSSGMGGTLSVSGNGIITEYLTVSSYSKPSSSGPITGKSTVCAGETNVTYNINPNGNATSFQWVPPSGTTVVGSTTNSAITLNFSSSFSGGTLIGYGIFGPCGSGQPVYFTISASGAVPSAAGSISGSTTIAPGQTGVSYSVSSIANASSYIWSLPSGASIASGGGTNSIVVNFSSSYTGGIISVYGTNGTCNGTSSSLTLRLSNFPAAAGSISGSSYVCLGSSGTSTTYSIQPITNATNYNWNFGSAGGLVTPIGNTNSTSVTVNIASGVTSITLTVYGSNSSGNGGSSTLTVPVYQQVGSSGLIMGPTSVCPGQTGVLYTTSSITNATAYNWNFPTGVTVESGTTNTSKILDFPSTFTGGTIVVSGNNGPCVSSTTVLQVSLPSLPGAAGSISGNTTVCLGATGVSYSVGAISGATGYVWTLPAGASIASGSNSNSITVNFSSASYSGSVSVYGTNCMGNGSSNSLPINVTPLPSAAGSISGSTGVCPGSTGVTYSVGPIGGATGYTWILPSGATIASGSNTNSITVNFPNPYNGGAVSVYGNNCSGNGSSSSINVAGYSLPSASITPNPANVCEGKGLLLNGNPSGGSGIYSTHAWSGAGVSSLDKNNIVNPTFTNATAGVYTLTYTVTDDRGCQGSASTSVTVNSNPSSFNVTGGSGNCKVTVGLGGSQSGINYQLYNGSTVLGTIGGTGGSISFGNQTVAGSFTVKATNNSSLCWAWMNGNASVTILPLPEDPGTINSDNHTMCLGTSGNSATYSVSPILNVDQYVWSVTGGATITYQNNNTITVNYPVTAIDGTVSVYGTNCSGNGPSSTLLVKVYKQPSGPITHINGSPIPCIGLPLNYSIEPVTNAASYSWVLPFGATINSGEGTNDITVTFSSIVTNGSIQVIATNGPCTPSNFSMTLSSKVSPAAPYASSNQDLCSGSTIGDIKVSAESGCSIVWYPSASAGTPFIANTPLTAGTYYAQALNSNCSSITRTAVNVTLYPYPVITQQPSDMVLRAGSPASFGVIATGPGLTYQWRKDGNKITNASLPVYSISSALKTDNGSYDAIVTGTAGCSVVSTVSNLSVKSVRDQVDKNFLVSRTILQDGVYDENSAILLPVSGIQESVTYFDGLGRSIQNVMTQGSPGKQDVIQPIVYDEYGRESIKYLPYSNGFDGWYKVDALADPVTTATNDLDKYRSGKQYLFYQNMGLASDQYPYSQTIFESSPLNRIMEQGAPGNNWQPIDVSISNSGHTQKISYQFNIFKDVLFMQVDGSFNLVFATINGDGDSNGKYYYKAGELVKNVIANENYNLTSSPLNTTEELKDKTGKVLLKRTYVTNAQSQVEALETYYVYDDLGLLRYVIPPKAVKQLNLPLNSRNDLVKQLCYYYEYDAKKRMVLKQLPGADPVYMVYDFRDRLVLTQDGEQRKTNQWLFTKYDVFNRPVVTGLLTYGSLKTQMEMQTIVNTAYSGTPQRSYAVSPDNTTETGYADGSFPMATIEGTLTYLTATYYDNYSYASKTGTQTVSPYIFAPELGNTANNPAVLGQVTGTKVKILGTSNWLLSTNYYDNKYRIIQTTRQNNVGGADRVTNFYDFPGKILNSLYTHTGSRNTTIAKRFVYDHAGRLLQIFHKIDANTEVLMSSMQYNEVGQLVNKKLHSSDTQYLNYLQSIDYQYNIRGWLKKINDPATVGQTHANEGSKTIKPDVFGMDIRYNDPFQ